jgi:hypothetical protein
LAAVSGQSRRAPADAGGWTFALATTPSPLAERKSPVIQLDRIGARVLAAKPFPWASVNELFAPPDAAALAESFPRDCFKTVYGYDGEKGYAYEARALVHLGENSVAHAAGLSAPWRELTAALNSTSYRAALSRLSGCDLLAAPVEINAFHYPPLAWLGPHVDLKDTSCTSTKVGTIETAAVFTYSDRRTPMTWPPRSNL